MSSTSPVRAGRAEPPAPEPPALPREFAGDTHQAAAALDERLGGGRSPSEQKLHDLILTHRDLLHSHLHSWTGRHALSPHGPETSIAWPPWLYIPADADWKRHWILPPPDAHRYALAWAPPPPPSGYAEASREDGTLYAIQRIRTIDRSATSEAGVGILFTPERTLSVVSLQPRVDCAGNYRWFQMMDRPVAGFTQVAMSVLVAAWHRIPGTPGWDLVAWKGFTARTAGPNHGSGLHAIIPYQRSFSGAELATSFLVQKGRTYLLGVVARVDVLSTLTDDRGRPLPLVEDGSFRVWGSLACRVPRLELYEQQVHIP